MISAVIPHFFAGRLANLRLIIESLKVQTLGLEEIVVWNNDPTPMNIEVRVINSLMNVGPAARFWAALTCDTEYVFFQDNDVRIGPRVLEQMASWIPKYPNTVLSLHGYNVLPGGSYRTRAFVLKVASPTAANVTLGRAELVPVSVVQQAMQNMPDPFPRMDDLWFSSRLRQLGVPIMVVPGAMENLPGHDMGASADGSHYQEREVLFKELFPKEVV